MSCVVRAFLSPKKLILILGFSKCLRTSGVGVEFAGFWIDVLMRNAAGDISWLWCPVVCSSEPWESEWKKRERFIK